jgi:hypothetical protein
MIARCLDQQRIEGQRLGGLHARQIESDRGAIGRRVAAGIVESFEEDLLGDGRLIAR